MNAKKTDDSDKSETKKQYRLLVTLNKEEYEMLEQINKFNGKPMATTFMECVREMKWLNFVSKCFTIAKALRKTKDMFFSKNKDHSFLIKD